MNASEVKWHRHPFMPEVVARPSARATAGDARVRARGAREGLRGRGAARTPRERRSERGDGERLPSDPPQSGGEEHEADGRV